MNLVSTLHTLSGPMPHAGSDQSKFSLVSLVSINSSISLRDAALAIARVRPFLDDRCLVRLMPIHDSVFAQLIRTLILTNPDTDNHPKVRDLRSPGPTKASPLRQDHAIPFLAGALLSL
jgi:hypothetical protein